MENQIVNRVQNSNLKSIDLDDYINMNSIIEFDLKLGLYEGLILKERDFRMFLKDHDWSQYEQKTVYVHCSSDAIIPTWAYMLVATKLNPITQDYFFGTHDELERELINKAVESILHQDLKDAKVVIKGCGQIKNRDYAYFQLTKALLPQVSSIMYGEPCSTVPVYKKPKSK